MKQKSQREGIWARFRLHMVASSLYDTALELALVGADLM